MSTLPLGLFGFIKNLVTAVKHPHYRNNALKTLIHPGFLT